MKVKLANKSHAPDKGFHPYFTQCASVYQALRRGEEVDLPADVVSDLRSVVTINETEDDGASIIEEVEEEEIIPEPVVEEEPESESVEEVDDDLVAEKLAKEYFNGLVDVQGIGATTANDIMELYPTKELLSYAMINNREEVSSMLSVSLADKLAVYLGVN